MIHFSSSRNLRIAVSVWSVLSLAAFADANDSGSVVPTAVAESTVAAAAIEHGITPEIAQKLSGDQIIQAMKDLQDFRLREKGMTNKARRFGPEVFVPVVAIGGFFLTVILLVIVPLFLYFRRNRLLHETLRTMVEKGMEIPPALLAPPVKPRNDLRFGIIGVSSGIGISLFFLALTGIGDKNLWAIGLIPLAIGIGYIVVWKLENRIDTIDDRNA
jgi:hypothetical protein